MTTTNMVHKSKYKFIAVRPETHARLLELGNMHDSMDDVIMRYLPKEHAEGELKTWQCSTCGLFVSGSTNKPPTIECFECHSFNWHRGADF